MPRKRLSYADIIAGKSKKHFSAAELARKKAEDDLLAAGGSLVGGAVSRKPAQVPTAAAYLASGKGNGEDGATIAQGFSSGHPVGDCAAEARRYAENLVSGQIPACKLAVNAAKRFLNDIEHGPERGFRFDAAACQKVANFLGRLDVGTLQPFQYFMLAALFGFIRDDGTRRTRTAFVSIAKKNGKSSLCAGLGLYMAAPAGLGGDGEERPGIDYCANTRYQAQSIVFKETVRLVEACAPLSAITKTFKTVVDFPGSLGTVEALAANSDKLNGRRSHFVCNDELADAKTPDLWNTLTSGQIGRRSPLALAITTSGSQREGNVAFEMQQHAEQILEGMIDDDAFFAFICSLDPEDDWKDEAVWIKANPGLGSLIPLDNLRDACKRAQSMHSAKTLFLRYHANRWSEVSAHSWLTTEMLQNPRLAVITESERSLTPQRRIANAAARLADRPCVMGLDLARTNDLTAMCLLFPPTDFNGVFELLFKFWCPEDSIVERSRVHRVPYERWKEHGYITATPGNIIDTEKIREEILELKDKFCVSELAFDPKFAVELTNALKFTMELTSTKQGFELGAAISKIEQLLAVGRLCVHGHPVALWNFSNAVLLHGSRGDVALDKKKSREKIDGSVAAAIAFDAYLKRPPQPKPSIFVL